MKKKILSFVLALCLIIPAVMFVGCGKTPPDNKGQEYVGTYIVDEYSWPDIYEYTDGLLFPTKIRDAGSITRAEYEAISNKEIYCDTNLVEWLDKKIELNSDYSFIETDTYTLVTIKGSWVLGDNEIILLVNGQEYFHMIINGDKTLTIKANRNETYKFVKVEKEQ